MLASSRKIIDYAKEAESCRLCGSDRFQVLGVRGNREYFGADPKTEPHLFTNIVRCIDCDFVFTNPRIVGLEHLERSHYESPDSYQVDDSVDIEHMFRARLRLIAKYHSRGRLMDIGAGKGEFLNEAKQAGWDSNGLEPSKNFCAYAKKTYGLKLFHGHLDSSVPFEKGSFDVITLNHVLEHVDCPLKLLQDLRIFLKLDGILFVEVPNADSWMLRIADLYFRMRGKNWSTRLSPLHPPFHSFGYTKKSLRFILEKSGFSLITLVTSSGKERGLARRSKFHLAVFLRDLCSLFFGFLGNRELLCAVAKPNQNSFSSAR